MSSFSSFPKLLLGLCVDLTYYLDSFNELSRKERLCIRSLSLQENPANRGHYSKKGLVDALMGNLHCSKRKAESLFHKLLELGLREMSELELTLVSKYDQLDAFSLYESNKGIPLYDLRKFASMRGYFSLDEYPLFCEKMKSYEE